MTDYNAIEFPLPEFYVPELTSSLDDGLERWGEYALYSPDDLVPIGAEVGTRNIVDAPSDDYNAVQFPDWSSELFGRILVVPKRLDLGNVLSDQSREVEVANLFLTDVELQALSTDVLGLTLVNDPVTGSPPTPLTISPFGSFVLEVAIEADGPATIDGDITFTFDVYPLDVPVTGTRVIVFAFRPLIPIREMLEWKTDIIEAYDGTEQRAALRQAPVTRLTMSFIRELLSDNQIRQLFFDWLPRPFAVPLWFEAERTTAGITSGDLTVNIDTTRGRFAAGQLVFIYADDQTYEAIEVESLTDTSVTLVTGVVGNYPSQTIVTPVMVAYAKTVPNSSRIPNVMTQHTVEFTEIEPTKTADAMGASVYDGQILMDDCNLSVSGEADGWDRPVTVLDSGSGRVLQFSRMDYSRFRTRKVWRVFSQEDIWRIRRLLHYLNGSRDTFFLPSFRADFTVTATIGPASASMRVVNTGYSKFSRGRRPFGEVRITRTVGLPIVRSITSITSITEDGSEELITVDAPFDNSFAITVPEIVRAEFVYYVRISDDTAEFVHDRLGQAEITINLVGVKE